MVEVQALVDASPLSNPRRVALGLEQNRLAMLLGTARAESRATGLPVWWRPADPTLAEEGGFSFVGLPAASRLPAGWLDADVQAEIDGDTRLTLGPEAIIGAQRVWLRLDERRIAVATDGLGPFEPQPGDAP